MIDRAQIAAALAGASSLELYQLMCMIERMLADPRRIIEVRRLLHQGQSVRGVDARSGELVSMRIVALHDTAAAVLTSTGTSNARRVPYVAIEPPQQVDDVAVESARPAATASPARRPGPGDFKRGDKVTFADKYLRPQVGVVVRVNQRTVSVDCENGESWRVGFHALRHIIDI